MADPVAVVLEADDLRVAAVSYALPLARMLRPGAGLSLRSVSLAEGEGGLAVGDLSAVVEFEAAGPDDAEPNA